MKQVLLFILLFILFSCADKSDEPIFVVEVDDEFEVTMKEVLVSDETKRPFSFTIKTLEPITCSEASIETDLEINDNQFNIQIKGITKPENCDAIQTIVEKEIPLGHLANGIYTIQFILQETLYNWGQMEVSDDAYSISMQNEFGIQIDKPILSKIPANTFWGYLAYDGAEIPQKIFTDLNNMLRTINATPASLASGEYYHFKIYAGSAPSLNIELEQDSRSFIYSYDGSTAEISAVFEALKSQYPNNAFSLKAFTSTGIEVE